MEQQIMRMAVELFFDDDENDQRPILQKVLEYAEIIVPNYTDRQFQSHFRITPTTFETVYAKLHLSRQNNDAVGYLEISLDKQLMIALWYLANIESFRGVADRFGVSKATAWQCLYKICRQLLVINNTYKIIALPNVDECNVIINSFRNRTGFPGIMGLIDGSHIPIKAPKENANSYINRKSFHSILLQGVCDHRRMFIDCYAGEAGSIHDACLFRRSELGQRLNNIQIPQDGYLLGDCAYPLSIKMLVPYKDNGHLTDIQKYYNTIHSKTRVRIEQTFALLKGRFRRLKLLETVRLDYIPLIIISACILHNVAQSTNDILGDLDLQAELLEERIMNPDINILPVIQNNLANIKRNNIANLLYMRRQ